MLFQSLNKDNDSNDNNLDDYQDVRGEVQQQVQFLQRSHLQCLSEEGPLLHFCPLNALQTELHLLTRGSLHVQEEVQQRADQPGRLGLGDGVQEGPDIFQQAPELCKDWR